MKGMYVRINQQEFITMDYLSSTVRCTVNQNCKNKESKPAHSM